MRAVFLCQECATHYLPPEGLEYGDGPASPVWCSVCQARAAALGIPEPALARMLALRAAEQQARPAADEPRRPDVRPSRPARTRRAGTGPGTRSRLG
ncbi:hypothetical protein [Kitasatospora sp. NBC_01539]|uniref:hypothetical protein n=1 Tax=Kitasatospora sp. NBC_01539 TaxID=2903577 RepID=UPI0038601021